MLLIGTLLAIVTFGVLTANLALKTRFRRPPGHLPDGLPADLPYDRLPDRGAGPERRAPAPSRSTPPIRPAGVRDAPLTRRSTGARSPWLPVDRRPCSWPALTELRSVRDERSLRGGGPPPLPLQRSAAGPALAARDWIPVTARRPSSSTSQHSSTIREATHARAARAPSCRATDSPSCAAASTWLIPPNSVSRSPAGTRAPAGDQRRKALRQLRRSSSVPGSPMLSPGRLRSGRRRWPAPAGTSRRAGRR